MLSCITFSILFAQNKSLIESRDLSLSQKAATAGLSTLKKLVTADNYKSYGIESVERLNNAKLGTPVEVYLIGLEDLKQFKPGDQKQVLVPANRAVYPVLATNNDVISSVELDYNNGKWEARKFGEQTATKTSAAFINQTHTDSIQRTFLVRIPSLSLNFLGAQTATGKIYLTYLDKQTIANIRTGESLPVEEVMQRLQPLAVDYNGLPR